MTQEAATSEQKAASSGCCGGMAKAKASAPALVKADGKHAADAEHADHKAAGGSCC